MAGVTTPEQRAAALAITGGIRNTQYKSLLRAFQRSSSAGKEHKQFRSGEILATKLANVSRETHSAELANLSKLLRQNRTGPPRSGILKEPPPDKKRIINSAYGRITLSKNGNASFLVDRNVWFDTGNKCKYELASFANRNEALEHARLYQQGKGERGWANALGKKFIVENRKQGTAYYTTSHNKTGKATRKRHNAQEDEWVVYIVDKIPERDYYLSLETIGFQAENPEDWKFDEDVFGTDEPWNDKLADSDGDYL